MWWNAIWSRSSVLDMHFLLRSLKVNFSSHVSWIGSGITPKIRWEVNGKCCIVDCDHDFSAYIPWPAPANALLLKGMRCGYTVCTGIGNVAKFQGVRIIFTYVLRSDSNVVACSTDSNEIYSDCSGIGLVLEHDLLFPWWVDQCCFFQRHQTTAWESQLLQAQYDLTMHQLCWESMLGHQCRSRMLATILVVLV